MGSLAEKNRPNRPGLEALNLEKRLKDCRGNAISKEFFDRVL